MKSPYHTFWSPRWLDNARRSDTARFGFALLCTVGAAFSWTAMVKPLADTTPYQVLLPFVALAAWFGGSSPGIITTILCVLWAITHSNDTFISLHQQLELGLFVPIGAFIAALSGSLGQARVRAQETADQLSVSQQRYQSIVETAAEGILMTDAALNISFVNARMASLLGQTSAAMQGRSLKDFLPPEDRDHPERDIAAHREKGHFEAEGRYLHSSGAEIWFLINASLLRNAAGEFSGLLALHTDVTERRAKDEELRRSHERFRLATTAVAGYIYEHDMNTGEIFRSSNFLDVLGHDPDQIPHNFGWWRQQLHPEDTTAFDAQMGATARRGEQFSLEYRARHANGSYRWLWDRGIVVRGNEGEILRIVGSVSDISGHKSAENALRESEANFRQLANSMPQFVWSSNPRGVPDYFNRRWYQYTGLKEGTVGGESWDPFLHPEDAERAREQWEYSVAHETVYRSEVRLRDHSGNYRWFLCRANPVVDEQNGEIVRWFATATDIDEQHRAAEAQKFLADVGVLLGGSLDPQITLEQVTRLAVPHLGDWCFVALKNSEGRPEMVAAAHRNAEKIAAFWKRHSKYGFDASMRKGIPYVIHTGNPEIVEEIEPEWWREVLPQAEYQQEVLEAGHCSSLVVPLEVRGQILGALAFSYAESGRHFSRANLPLAQEIARRAAIAIENARLYRQLQDADRRKDEFLAMLAHELRNPLAAISGASSLMNQLLEGEAKVITGTPRAIMERQTSHLARLVDDLMDVSRITRGKIELRRKEVDFAEVIKNALDGVRPLVVGRRHNLQVDLPSTPILVDADPARLGQIISNLVTNAAKYTDPGGQIVVTLRVYGSEAKVRVSDTGAGLAPEMLHSIWGLFVQSDRTLERSQGGLGIGLTLVKSLTEMHGGRVGAHSEGLGKGSEFFIALPLLYPLPEVETEPAVAPVEPAQSEAASPALAPAKTAAKKKIVEPLLTLQKRILVVDDNEDAALMLCAWLESRGHDVQVAHDGEQGLILACGWQPDIALLDIGMPGMDGYEVARKLRILPEGKTMRLIAVTGYGQPADRDHAFEAGFNFHLTKPVEMGALMKMIDS